MIDALWIALASVTLYAVYKMKEPDSPIVPRQQEERKSPQKMKLNRSVFRLKTKPQIAIMEISGSVESNNLPLKNARKS